MLHPEEARNVAPPKIKAPPVGLDPVLTLNLTLILTPKNQAWALKTAL